MARAQQFSAVWLRPSSYHSSSRSSHVEQQSVPAVWLRPSSYHSSSRSSHVEQQSVP